MDENKIWDIRAFVYQHLAETARPPLVSDVASRFALSPEEAVSAYEELHQRHALVLPMPTPLSGVETPFKVHANGMTYFANCAWDSLGIPAALHADAEVEAVCAQSGDLIRLSVSGGQVHRSDALVHFLTPFRDWYNDLMFT
jgi:hypothetical protein